MLFHRSSRPARRSPFGASPELRLQGFERHARPVARKTPTLQVITLHALDLAQDGLARIIALAAAGFLGESIEPLLDLGRQTKGEHFVTSVCYTCVAAPVVKQLRRVSRVRRPDVRIG